MTEQAERTAFGRFTSDADDEIYAAAHEHKIDPDFLKAIIAGESAGDWDKDNRVVSLSAGRILPYIGLFERDAKYHGIDFDGLIGDRFAQIRTLASILSRMQQDAIQRFVAQSWHCGFKSPGPGYPQNSSTVEHYVDNIMGWTRRLREERSQ